MKEIEITRTKTKEGEDLFVAEMNIVTTFAPYIQRNKNISVKKIKDFINKEAILHRKHYADIIDRLTDNMFNERSFELVNK